MITELAVERVEFTCGHCWNRWSIDYDVLHYRDGEGHEWEYFSRDGVAVASPYVPEGAPPCPQCGRRWVGRLVARRPIPAPPGPADTPRQKITDEAGHRPDRHDAPLLGAADHAQPQQPEPPADPTSAVT
ncbi:hypothetical protein NGB36_01580 [Streptomyces sp. RB6PN25]|uniref:Uncharacterized protein n=1 Tax=Streptomyces humicola TaxID=2953240 RepID=A0ABT1PNT1_9ACTN|nr:hypothetical protein [Streptomyces humicola]MCQ4079329.1 hypothetical protein [Streptomyces humicola]